MHRAVDSKPGVAGDTTLDDDVYIPPPDYSISDNLMAVPSGIFMRCISVFSDSIVCLLVYCSIAAVLQLTQMIVYHTFS